MKKIVSIALIFLLLVSVVACGDSGTSDGPSSPKSSQKAKYILENEVIADNDYCSVVLTKCEEKSSSIDFKFALENKTSDRSIMFAIDDTSANGWVLSSTFAETVAAGKKSNEILSFDKSDLEDVNLTSIDKLEFSLRVYDDDDWSEDHFVDDTFTIYPTGLPDEDVVSPERWSGNDEITFVDNNECEFVILGTYDDDIWGYSAVVYLENKTVDKHLMFAWDDVSVNGYMIDPFWATSVPAGNKKLTTISFSKSDFEDNDIDAVSEIEFSLSIYDENDYSADHIVDEVFTYNPAQ